MKRNILTLFIVIFSTTLLAQGDRLSVANELSKMAEAAQVRLDFSIDPNDDATLVINRISNLKPKELSGDWTFYLFSIGSSPEYLKAKGFNKVRIYTSQSKGINDYVLKIL